MSTTRPTPDETDRSPDNIRRFSVLIALFWLALAVVTNVFVPQLEKVAEAHNVSLSPQDAPSLQASKQIGKVFERVRLRQRGDDRPGGRPAARRRRAPLLRRLGRQALPGHQARRAHPGLLGRSADGGRLAEHRRQGGVGAGVPRRQPGRVAGQRVRRLGAQHRRTTRRRRRASRPTSPAPRPWSPISSRWAGTAP